MKKYSALIVDLKRSKSYSRDDRYSIQEYIFNVIDVLNRVFSRAIEKKVDFSAGDEIQGLFSSCEAAYLFLRMFNMLVSPVEIRAGIGIGNWDVVIEKASTTAQDGQAYHNARHAIEQTKSSNGYSVLLYSDRSYDYVVNSIINCTTLIIDKHSEYQNELMLLSELLYPIDACGIVDQYAIPEIVELLYEKESIDYYRNYFFKRRNSHKSYAHEFSDKFFHFKSNVVDAMEEQSDFFITIGKQRGLPVELSQILGISRQSIEKTIKIANIYEARNATVTALKLMKKYW